MIQFRSTHIEQGGHGSWNHLHLKEEGYLLKSLWNFMGLRLLSPKGVWLMHMYNTHSKEDRRPNAKQNFMFKFISHLAIKYEFYFIIQYKNNNSYQKNRSPDSSCSSSTNSWLSWKIHVFSQSLSLLISKTSRWVGWILNLVIGGRIWWLIWVISEFLSSENISF